MPFYTRNLSMCPQVSEILFSAPFSFLFLRLFGNSLVRPWLFEIILSALKFLKFCDLPSRFLNDPLFLLPFFNSYSSFSLLADCGGDGDNDCGNYGYNDCLDHSMEIGLCIYHSRVILQAAHINLIVKMTNVANYGIVLHLSHVANHDEFTLLRH